LHGEKRANDTHESKTDPDAKLFRKGNSQPAKLYFMGCQWAMNFPRMWAINFP
jgi:hypothetical protein